MKIYKYQLILLGNANAYRDSIEKALEARMNELSIPPACRQLLGSGDIETLYSGNVPSYCLYFGDEERSEEEEPLIKKLINDAVPILPVINEGKPFRKSVPEILHKVNKFTLSGDTGIAEMVNYALEAFGLLGSTKKLFISYLRNESSKVALSLYEQLGAHSFDVFLDTHAICPGEMFQEELWHRLSDAEIVLLLNTGSILTSEWVRQELTKANQMQVGIVQLQWPQHKSYAAQLDLPISLAQEDFTTRELNQLTEVATDRIIAAVESFRARSYASRHANLVGNFLTIANRLGIEATLQPWQYIEVKAGEKELTVIPTVGVPTASLYYNIDKKEKEPGKRDTYLLYDTLNIRKQWLDHLNWLDTYLPIHSVQINNIESWLLTLL